MTHDPMHPNAMGNGDGCRVCEIIARVREDERGGWEPWNNEVSHDAGYSAGRADALDAARDAVAAVSVRKDTSYEMRVCALAAIDVLKGGTNGA